ncbi:DUF2066 domain-containing protein [Bradyrhizobium sp.]|uniref:DUF2066 domain-containing protein n=1 Tax=Bradyrhizobium sp. TaxID=376 RepID=UPI0025B82B1A|nr:DUF2066 domain-containing protein [Bradyrhizobium sp.]
MALVVALACCTMAKARAADDLYRAQTVLTGQGEANRMIGFAACLEDVLIKVSGALKLAGDPRLQPYKARASEFVKAYRYHDKMSGTPVRDEQGTRDRPYDLFVDFDDQKINGILSELGLKPWLSRPVLGVFVAMEQGARTYVVSSDARASDLQRDALLAAADKRGLRIILPDEAALARSSLTGPGLATRPSSALAQAVADQGAELVLIGHLRWDDADLGWATDWHFDWQGRPYRWQFRGVTFDEAFRRGIGGAAQILSGNGDPL